MYTPFSYPPHDASTEIEIGPTVATRHAQRHPVVRWTKRKAMHNIAVWSEGVRVRCPTDRLHQRVVVVARELDEVRHTSNGRAAILAQQAILARAGRVVVCTCTGPF